jgi:hypothetical protein
LRLESLDWIINKKEVQLSENKVHWMGDKRYGKSMAERVEMQANRNDKHAPVR